MKRVRIVGGGLTGILAALQAHRLGARDIVLHERLDALGGVARPQVRNGLELREGCLYFGPPGDPVRALLEAHGLAFTDFDNGFASVSPAWTADFGGPALPGSDIALTAPAGPSLADRIAAYPPGVAAALDRYVRWHLDCDPATLHHEAAIPMAINRVYPMGADLAALARAKREDPLADELWAIPRGLWGRTANLTAALPRDGFPLFLARCRRALIDIGVEIREHDLISPRQALDAHAPDEVLVWAASPTPLFKAAGLPTPRSLSKSFTSHTFLCDGAPPLPAYVQNFTAQGACFRAYVYESGGQALVTAECVREVEADVVRAEVTALLAPFGGEATPGACQGSAVRPRWIYHTVEAMRGLTDLRTTLHARLGDGFIAGAWEPYSKAEKFAQIETALACALGREAKAVAA